MHNSYQQFHRQLIEQAGGQVEDIFVLRTGVLMTKRSQITSAAAQLFETLHLDTTRADYEQHAEFNSRITYLSFPEEKQSAAAYHEKMIHQYGHRSIYNDEHVTFLIAGCAVETALEFIAHNEATIARLTSSKTKAQNAPLFKLLGNDPAFHEKQKQLIYNYIEAKEAAPIAHHQQAPNNEYWNLLHFGNKVVSFTITMSIKDWHKTLIGRLCYQGVETDLRPIMETIALQLKEAYPLFFDTVEAYYQLGNQEKYQQE